MAIHEISTGLPRIINVLSDNALMSGFALQTKPVDADIVREIGRDFDFGVAPAANRAPPVVRRRRRGPARRLASGDRAGPGRMLAEPLDRLARR